MAPKIVCVVGPTACGKTTLGVLLAKKFGGEVVSADSMQIYRGMTIGTAAPTEEEMDSTLVRSISPIPPATPRRPFPSSTASWPGGSCPF